LIPPKPDYHVIPGFEFGQHPGGKQGTLTRSGSARHIQDRFPIALEPAKNLLVGIIGAIETLFALPRAERKVACLEGSGDFGVALDTPLFDERWDRGGDQREEREGRHQPDASPWRDTQLVKSALKLLKLRERQKQRDHVRS